jgi:hypothetical protein
MRVAFAVGERVVPSVVGARRLAKLELVRRNRLLPDLVPHRRVFVL